MPAPCLTQPQKFTVLQWMLKNKDELNNLKIAEIRSKIRKDLGFKVTDYAVRQIIKDGGIPISLKMPANERHPVAFLARKVERLEMVVDHITKEFGIDLSSVLQEVDKPE